MKLTDDAVRALIPPAKGNRITYDDDVKGFGVRITARGALSFVLNYFVGGRERRQTIGSFPTWKCGAARKRAQELRRLVDAGRDPLGEREAEREAPTVADLAARYLVEISTMKRPGSQVEDKALVGLVAAGIGRMKLADVRRTDIERLHRKVTIERGSVRANRMLTAAGALFARGIAWELMETNPARGIPKNPEQPRERFLSPPELQRLMAALAAREGQPGANAIRLLLLTGARRGEVLSGRWEHFDLCAGIWEKPAALTKQARRHRIPLSAPARMLLARMAEKAEGPMLFPGSGGSGCMVDIKRTWRSVCRTAGIEGVRLHDLRHSYASYLASAGLSLPVIGALLGHSQTSTTQRYAHLLDDPLRQATERVGALVDRAERPETAGDFIPLTRWPA
jgi:integrase